MLSRPEGLDLGQRLSACALTDRDHGHHTGDPEHDAEDAQRRPELVAKQRRDAAAHGVGELSRYEAHRQGLAPGWR